MEILETDLIIIGAGPAGCSVARSIKDKEVILIDKNRSPRDKPCSGLLVEESKKILYSLGLPNNVFGSPSNLDLEHIDIDNNIDIIQKKALGNTDRIKLDYWLLKLIGKNTNLMENTVVTKLEKSSTGIKVFIIEEGKEKCIIAKSVVGADGATSTVRRFLGILPPLRYYTAQNFIETDKKIETCKFIYWNALTDWYAWILPKEDNIVEVGGAFQIKINRDEVLKLLMKKMDIDGKIIKKTNWLLSKPNLNDINIGNNIDIFLTGEAAGFISPSTGEGISFGLRSGEILGKSLNTENPGIEYKNTIKPLVDEVYQKISKAKLLSDPKQRISFLNSISKK